MGRPSDTEKAASIVENGGSTVSASSTSASPTTEKLDVNEEIRYPDGGTRAWLVVVGAFMTVFCGFGLAAAAGGFQSYYRTDLLRTYSDSQIAWISSAQNFFTFFPAIFTGSLFDRYGHRPLIAVGAVSLTLGFVFLSLSTKFYQVILCHATLIAFGCDLMFICPIAIIAQWFNKRKGLAFGLSSCGSSIGSVVWPLVLANLPAKIGFGWTCRVFALFSGLCGVCSFFMMKTRFKPAPRDTFFVLEAFKTPQYSLTVLNFFTWTFGFVTFQMYIGRFGQVLQLGSTEPYLLIIANGVSTFGRLSSGIIADRIGVMNVILLGNAVLAALFWAWIACTTNDSAIALAVLVGMFSGAFVSLQGPFATMTAKDPKRGGTMLGQAICLQSFAPFIAGPTFGALLTSHPTVSAFRAAITLPATMMSIALASVVGARWFASKSLVKKV